MAKLNNSDKVLISTVHGLGVFLLLWCINNTSYSSSVDEALLKKIIIFEDLLFPKKAKATGDFIFVNSAKDIKIIKDTKDYGFISITDREKLALFFKILADSNQHRFILCDIFFEFPSAGDSALATQISKCKKILFPEHFDNGMLRRPVIKVPSAIGDYQTYNGKFSKFRLLYNDSLKTVPLVLYEQNDGKRLKLNYLTLNSFSPRYYIRPYHLSNGSYPYFNLGELLQISSLNKSFYNDYLKNKFIVIGNFDTDAHYTPIGKMAGSLILINSYLSLEEGRAKLNWAWIIFILFSSIITSYILFFVKISSPTIRVSPWIDFIIHNFLNKIFSFLGICAATVFLSELFFSIQLIISPLYLYLVYVSWVISFYNEHFKKQQV